MKLLKFILPLMIAAPSYSGEWEIFIPLSLPGYNLDRGDTKKSSNYIRKNMESIAAWGGKYTHENGLWIEHQGKYGRIEDNNQGMDIKFAERIHSLEAGMPIYTNNKFNIDAVIGARYYDIRASLYSEGLRQGNDHNSWTEGIAGLKSTYQFNNTHSIEGSYTYGSDDSYRTELNYRTSYDNNIFTKIGYRQDKFYNDNLHVVESGAVLTFGYIF